MTTHHDSIIGRFHRDEFLPALFNVHLVLISDQSQSYKKIKLCILG